MYKYIATLVRQDGMSHEAFTDYWQTEHAPIARDIEGAVRYNQVLPSDPETAEFDGLAEVFFEDLDALQDAFGGPDQAPDPDKEHATRTRKDTANFLDVGEISEFVGREEIQKDQVGGDTDGLYKHSAFLVRQDGMSHEEFVEYWQHNHTPIARDIEGVVRYATVLPASPAETAFDGVAELYFETIEDLHDALGSPGSRDYDPTKEVAQKAREDVDNFLAIERRPRFIGREHVVTDER